MIQALAKATNSLHFSWPVQSEPEIKGTTVSSFSVCMCRWYKLGVNLAADLVAAVLLSCACKIFPPTLHDMWQMHWARIFIRVNRPLY